MAPTTHELRNEIRSSIGQFQRDHAIAITEEELAAICDAISCEIEQDTHPSTAQRRAEILATIRDANHRYPPT